MFCNVSFGGILGDILKKFEKEPPACMEGDCENGYGTYVWENGDKYVGAWMAGWAHGQGTETYADKINTLENGKRVNITDKELTHL